MWLPQGGGPLFWLWMHDSVESLCSTLVGWFRLAFFLNSPAAPCLGKGPILRAGPRLCFLLFAHVKPASRCSLQAKMKPVNPMAAHDRPYIPTPAKLDTRWAWHGPHVCLKKLEVPYILHVRDGHVHRGDDTPILSIYPDHDRIRSSEEEHSCPAGTKYVQKTK